MNTLVYEKARSQDPDPDPDPGRRHDYRVATLLYTLQCIEVVDQSLDHLGHSRPKRNN